MMVAALLWIAPAALSAQGPLRPGDRVRVTQADGSEVTGTVQYVRDGDIRLLTVSQADRLLPSEGIRSVERSLGRERNFVENFVLSVVGGAAVGGLLGAVTWTPCNDTGFMACFLHPSSRSEAFGFGMIVGGTLGVPIGLVLGLADRDDIWEPVTVPGPDGLALQMAPVVGVDRVGFTASIPLRGF